MIFAGLEWSIYTPEWCIKFNILITFEGDYINGIGKVFVWLKRGFILQLE